MHRVWELLEVGSQCRVQYVEDGKVVLEAQWKEVDGAFGWALVDAAGKVLSASQDVLLDANWRKAR